MRAAGIALVLLAGLACAPKDPRPSIVLVVLDTVRTSAVSAYGEVEGTTPAFDVLAAEGILYRQAIAPSPWTLPSHATLLTGLGVDVHRVGTPGRVSLAEDVVTLAERLDAAGYQTAAFSENLVVSDAFQLLQGFEVRRTSALRTKEGTASLRYFDELDVLKEVRAWLDDRDPARPFFLFVNLLDAHGPYSVRDENRWTPATATRDQMERFSEQPEHFICDEVPRAADVEVLRGLYRGDVNETDDFLRRILARVENHGRSSNVITIVTSDHGELFGDRRLLGHEFAVRPGALGVPLVVHGLSAPAAEVAAPVTLADVTVSILEWTGVGVPAELEGRTLPTSDAAAAPGVRTLVSAYTDDWPQAHPERDIGGFADRAKRRQSCGPDDKVRGGMLALTRHPYRFYWFARYEPELYDLRWDTAERFDIAAREPQRVEELIAEIEPFARRAGLWPGETHEVEVQPSAREIESLRALGYID